MSLTIPKLLIATFGVATGVLFTILLHKLFPNSGLIWIGYGLGFLVGDVAGLFLLWSLVRWRTKLFLSFPPCRRGKCLQFERDYTYRQGTLSGWIDWGKYHYRCRCGDQYLRKGNRFMEVAPDGSLKPYKKLNDARKWVDDT